MKYDFYLSGPMSGIPDNNYPAFNAAAKRIRSGHSVYNPAEHEKPGQSWEAYLREDLEVLVRDCAAVALLPGWRKSKGALLEVYVAQSLGMPLLAANNLEPVLESEAQEAHRLVLGDRQSAYGHPSDDFTRTGRMWGAILDIDDVPPERVGLCMAAVKISREVNKHKRDNLVDLCGYALTVGLVEGRRKEIP